MYLFIIFCFFSSDVFEIYRCNCIAAIQHSSCVVRASGLSVLTKIQILPYDTELVWNCLGDLFLFSFNF